MFKVFLVGITCSSHDIQLSVFQLKSALLASDLRDKVDVQIGHYSHVLPHEFEERCAAIAQEVIESGAQLVGFSVYVWNRSACLRIAELVKCAAPQVVTVFGGPEITYNKKQDNADVIFVGEGEIHFVTLVGLETGERRNPYIGEFSLDAIPSPYLFGIVPDDLLQQPGFKAVIETQRGCNLRCAYCNYHKNFSKVVYKNLYTAIAEIDYAYRHGASAARIADGNFLSDAKRATEIIRRLIELEVKIPLYFEFIPSFVTNEFAFALKEYISRCAPVTVGIGLQTTNQEALKVIRRAMPIKSLDKAYRLMAQAGATVSTDLILGLPRETADSFLASLEYVAGVMRNGKHILHVSLLMNLPGTDMEQIVRDEGLTISDDSHFVYETPTMPRSDLVYCARVVAAAYRFLNDDELRPAFYENCVKPISRLRSLALDMFCFLRDSGSDMATRDFPRIEHYWNFDVFKEISRGTARNMLARVEGAE